MKSESTTRKSANLQLRSGDVSSDDPLVSFLYELMRDHVVPGKVEELVQNAVPSNFTNGYLANYAIDLAARLDPDIGDDYLDEQVAKLNTLHERVCQRKANRPGRRYSYDVGSIESLLHAYREGDIDLKGCANKLSLLIYGKQ